MQSLSSSSILIFEINKKFLLFKILSKEFHELLRTEIIKKFGIKYIDEKNLQSENFGGAGQNENEESRDFVKADEEQTETEDLENVENNGSTTEADDNPSNLGTSKKKKQKKKLILTNDLIYEYFSPIVNSFEISKEMNNYIYEYALFNKSQYIIRFNLHKNCLFMCIQDFNSSPNNLFKPTLEMTKHIYSDFNSGWCCKSLISLFKYKFGICSDEKCFTNKTNHSEITELFTAWSNYYLMDQIYFLEVIEQLDVSEDTKLKCKSFLDE